MAEAAFAGLVVLNYFALMAPAGPSPAVISSLNSAINRVVAMPDVLAGFKTDAVEAAAGSPAALGEFIEAAYGAWRNVVKTQNLKLD